MDQEKINILLVDDQPAKLISYEVMLSELGENLIKASSARVAFEHLLKNDIAVVLVDVCMPELDGFELAAMIREHPRFERTAIIFVSAIHMADDDRLRGYRMGAVDYMPVPVVPDILRAKVRVFAELYRKTRQLEQLNTELERRVAERTEQLETSTARLLDSEKRRSVALAAGQMGSWDWDIEGGTFHWDDEHCRIAGVDPATFRVSPETVQPLVNPEDWKRLEGILAEARAGRQSFHIELQFRQPGGQTRWCAVTAAASFDGAGRLVRLSGVTSDITDRKTVEERHTLLAREVDHRAKNALALVQSILRLTRADTTQAYVKAVEGRIAALSHAHTLLSESRWQGADLQTLVRDELAPYAIGSDSISIDGPSITLQPATAQSLALIVHELATNSAKYGALSDGGRLSIRWTLSPKSLDLAWLETGCRIAEPPKRNGFGINVVTATVKSQLRGDVVFDWRQSGLLCNLSIPVEPPRQTPADGGALGAAAASAAGKSVLLVEDEALVGMMMQDMLTDIGFAPVGPYGRTATALAAARSRKFVAAVLDVNLGGETVYDVADYLAAQNIPFVFVSGYGRESIESRFAGVPLLNKPVERQRLKAALAGCLEPRKIATTV